MRLGHPSAQLGQLGRADRFLAEKRAVAHQRTPQIGQAARQRRAVRPVPPRPPSQRSNLNMQNPGKVKQDREAVNRADSPLHLRQPGFRAPDQASQCGLAQAPATAISGDPRAQTDPVHATRFSYSPTTTR